jgi:hypothetical protein
LFDPLCSSASCSSALLPLGLLVRLQASLADIRAAYKTLSLTCHPDKIRTSTTKKLSRAEEAAQKAQVQARWAKIEQVSATELHGAAHQISFSF